jgi:hypothetical protein
MLIDHRPFPWRPHPLADCIDFAHGKKDHTWSYYQALSRTGVPLRHSIHIYRVRTRLTPCPSPRQTYPRRELLVTNVGAIPCP